jgi:hypothetical protein
MIGNVVEFVTMTCGPVSGSVPASDKEIEEWKREKVGSQMTATSAADQLGVIME